ncbi:MAG: ATP-binding protein [Bacteroidales bacterium]|nr:ATP-binding protein [Bacteroidales bacterium]
MVAFKKIRWIPVLMIVSQLMLTGFVAYWLKGQYDDQKELLSNELSRIYDETRDQVIDTLLFSRVVEPALKDTLTFTMTSTGNRLCNEATVVAIALPDSIPQKKMRKGLTSISFDNHKEDMLIRSVKLFINHTGDSSKTSESYSDFLPGKIDTVLFKKLYYNKIALKNYGITATWLPADTSTSVRAILRSPNINTLHSPNITTLRSTVRQQRKPAMHFTTNLPDRLPGVQIKHEFPYLIRQMGTQILFGLILLLLTCSAFFFTNRSLKRQLILNSLRNDFVSNITHELRTPVSTVKVALEALKTFDKVSNPAITQEYLDMATQELNRLDQLISKVLDQSLIGEHKQVIQSQLSDIYELINYVLLALQPRLTARNATILYEPTGINGPIMVDPVHFQGVLINLIDNSLKFGGEKPEIRIQLRQEFGSICIEVSDNGPGIPKEYLSRVFDKFFRVPAGDTHNIKGYGLGLSFAALVMEQHHGSISVKNLDVGGCSFTLRFPQTT